MRTWVRTVGGGPDGIAKLQRRLHSVPGMRVEGEHQPRRSSGRSRAATQRGPGFNKNRRRPTLPGGCPPSTIGAEGLNCSVRNGKRCLPLAMRHRKFCETAPVELENRTRPMKVINIRQALDPLVPVCCRIAAVAQPAYQPGGLPGVLLSQGDGRAHLEVGFPLRCFQRLSDPYVAIQRCPWQDNWYTSGTFFPVLSY